MTTWRKEAFERLPEMRKQLQQEKGMYCFFSELVDFLKKAYEEEDYDLEKRIYQYAFHLCSLKRGSSAQNDVPTAITLGFFEHLPESKITRRNVGRWMTKKEIEGMKDTFLYHGTEKQYLEMLESVDTHKKHRVQPVGAGQPDNPPLKS
tara:strand:+ start:244 stop:690 length:447 start_codon:yes stop_codon:yes gene_type:complete